MKAAQTFQALRSYLDDNDSAAKSAAMVDVLAEVVTSLRISFIVGVTDGFNDVYLDTDAPPVFAFKGDPQEDRIEVYNADEKEIYGTIDLRYDALEQQYKPSWPATTLPNSETVYDYVARMMYDIVREAK
jgi:hypothetical protein